jgi:hypothetical protein
MRAIVVPTTLALVAVLASCGAGANDDGARWGADTISAAVAGVAPTEPAAAGERMWRSHDELEACLSVIGRVFEGRRGTADRSVDMHLRVDVPDSALRRAADSVRVMVHAAHSGRDGTPQEAPPLVLALDGDTLRVEGRTGHSILSKQPGGGAVDRVDYVLSLADARRIAAARGVEGDAGVARFTLAEDERAVFGAFAAVVGAPRGWDALGSGPLVGPDCLSLDGGR